MIQIQIKTDNAAFKGADGTENSFNRNMETVRILEGLVKKIKENSDTDWQSVALMDLNGNFVGNFCYDPLK